MNGPITEPAEQGSEFPPGVAEQLPWAREMLAEHGSHVFVLGWMATVVDDLLRGRLDAQHIPDGDPLARAYALYLVVNRRDGARADGEPRCTSCGEPWRLLKSGAVGHCGDENGNDCPTSGGAL
jgi:hypothetical protein